jgi:hypothetical protein
VIEAELRATAQYEIKMIWMGKSNAVLFASSLEVGGS